MNKHDELIERLDKLLEHFYSPYSPELISIHNKDEWSVTGRGITDARHLLQLYGDALEGIAPWLSASLNDYEHDGKREYGKACDAVFIALDAPDNGRGMNDE